MIHDFELDGPQSPEVPRNPVREPSPMRQTFYVLLAVGCSLIAIPLLFTPTYCDWKAARRAQCANNLKQIQLAIQAYEQKYGTFPPAYTADASGRRMHSWRALILPFLDLGEPIDYDFSEPWDGPHNIRLLNRMPGLFRCPEQKQYVIGATNYAAITGPGTMFPGASSVRRSAVKDGLENTICLVEVTNVPIPWAAPIDLDVRTMSFEINDPRQPSIGSLHPDGANVATAEGRVRFVKDLTSPETIRAMTTMDGGELIMADDL